MYLLIKAKNVKIWRFKYTRPYTKKVALISFGSYPKVSQQQARKLKHEEQELIKQGIDPQEHKAEQEQLKQEASNNTFYDMAQKWFKLKTEQGLTILKIMKLLIIKVSLYSLLLDLPITSQ